MDLVGTTVHFVDEGIDTGRIIDQAMFPITERDSFGTYPYLHLAAGIPILLEAVHRAMHGTLQAKSEVSNLPSRLRSYPTVWGYLASWISTGVK